MRGDRKSHKMSRYFYDLHIHSCLSPCADDDMTPENIAGMGALSGLGIMALTDHNSCKNLRPFFAACRRHGIVPVGGVELTTSEDIHLICLFPDLETAEAFGDEIHKRLLPVKNRPEIFGNQFIYGENDEIIATEEILLISATSFSTEEAVKEVRSRGGLIYPAHVDREANGIISVLGDIPPEPAFTCCEFNSSENIPPYTEKYSSLRGLEVLSCSDAHNLWSISGAENSVEIDDEPYSSAGVRLKLIEKLGRRKE